MTAVPQELINSDIAPTRRKEFVISSFKFSEHGLEPLGEPTKDEWVECGKYIKRSTESVQLWVGDWLNYGELRWGETYRDLVQLTGFDYQTLRDYKWVSSHVDLSLRKDKLSYSRGRFITGNPPT